MFPAVWPLPDTGWLVAASAAIGVIVGLQAAILSRLLYRIEDMFHRLPLHWMWWPAVVAVAPPSRIICTILRLVVPFTIVPYHRPILLPAIRSRFAFCLCFTQRWRRPRE